MLRVEVDEVLLEYALAKLEYLAPAAADDREAVESALSAMLDRLLASVTRNAVD